MAERKIEEIVSKVLNALADVPIDKSGEAWITGKQLQALTNLEPSEINIAIEALQAQGFVEVRIVYNTAPFNFYQVILNARGRLEVEKRKAQEQQKSAKKADVNLNEWDLFICHASEDKEEIVRPLVKALVDKGFKVWYDEFTLTIGDPLRRSIDKGLANSKYGVVVLSENFFAKNWPQAELDALAVRESRGEKVILPIWHKIDADTIKKYSPLLAGRIGIPTSKGIVEIVIEILKVVRPSNPKKAVSVRDRMKETLDSLNCMDEESIAEFVKQSDYSLVKQKLTIALNGIAYFNLKPDASSEGVFNYIELSILERPEAESKELFEILTNWFFQTVTPYNKIKILHIFVELSKLPYLKEAMTKANIKSAFISEFSHSHSYDVAGINAEILYSLQVLLSEEDMDRIVEIASINPQIKDSWRARKYLEKMISLAERRFGKEKADKWREKLK